MDSVSVDLPAYEASLAAKNDNRLSQAARPNENYARELMELYTLGVASGYTETDVTQVARALTGWTLTPRSYTQADNYNGATFQDTPAIHDNGVKTILGQTGDWNGYDAINIILSWGGAQGTKSGRFLGGKLWSFFAYPYPPEHIVNQLAQVYDANGRSIREVVRAIFLSPEF